MPRFAALFVALLLSTAASQTAQASDCRLPAGALPNQTRAVFVLDTSGSMRGAGDGKANIFEGVKGIILAYVTGRKPDQVELLTFDSGLRSRRVFKRPTASAASWTAWKAALGAVRADGRNTHLYRSLHDALTPLGGADEYLTSVFVLTDGIDNDRQKEFTPQQALAAFRGRGALDRLHYIALGTDIPAEARRALQDSPYADGLTVPVGQLPDLRGVGLSGDILPVVGETLKVPLPDNTRLALDSGALGQQVQLAKPATLAGVAALKFSGTPMYGTPALLCAASQPAPAGGVATKPARLLLRLNLPSAPALLTWLNPGADLKLAQGEEVVLRYRAPRSVNLSGAELIGLPAGLRGQVEREPGAHEFAVRLSNTGLATAQTVQPQLALRGAPPFGLPTLRGTAGGRPPMAQPGTPNGTGQTSLEGQTRFPRRLAWLLGMLLALGLLLVLLLRLRRTGGVQITTLVPARTGAEVPSVEGIEYGDDRTIALVSLDGTVTNIAVPLGVPFDLGQLARAPLLSGLRAQQHRDGLKLVRLPGDLEVSQGARLLRAGDVVRPGTLLGVAVAPRDRAPAPPLGSLAGLGLPITLRCDDLTIRASGPYGSHALTLINGVTDLGQAYRAPALNGLKVSTSGTHVLLAQVPQGLQLRRSGESTPLRAGTYLPAVTLLNLGENEVG